MILLILSIYFIIALLIYIVGAGTDYYKYKKSGITDNKFPITSIVTHKIIAGISLLWLFVILGLLYLNWTKDD